MTVYYSDDRIELHEANVTRGIPLTDGSVDCVVTSPPYYGLRDYGVDGQLGLEPAPGAYVRNLRHVFADVRRVLADDGTLWLNIGDGYAQTVTAGGTAAPSKSLGLRANGVDSLGDEGRARAQARQRVASLPRKLTPGVPMKNLLGIPWRVALALQADGWLLRNAVVWRKTNAMPQAAKDRLSSKYEMLFMFTKTPRYWYDLAAVSNNGPNLGDVWDIATVPFSGGHVAAFPPEMPRRCIVAGCKPGGTVLDPFHGSGTTGMVAIKNGRKYVGIELNREYLDLSMTTRLAEFVDTTERAEA